jgi:murein biosynthesis integral membrane protein MurJ
MVLGNQVLVPTFATWNTQVEAGRERRLGTTVLLTALVGGGLVALLLGVLGGPLLAALAPGFSSGQRELAVDLLHVMVLTIPLTAVSEVLRAWLNARHMFVVPAAMTAALNLTAAGIIVAVRGDIAVLPVAYVVGSSVQLVLMLLVALVRGLRLGRPAVRDAESAGLLRLMSRPTAAAGLNPLARVVETFVASFLPSGAVTILHYGNRLISAVGGTVLFRSIMIAVLPRLTRAYAQDNRAEAARLTVTAMRLMLVVSFPLTAVACVLAVPATVAVFGIGRFSEDDARLLGLVLVVLSVSLAPSAVQRALLAPFYATRETKVPLRNTVYGVLANWALLPLFLIPLWGSGYEVLGVAAAYSGAQFVNVAHAWRRLRSSDLEHSYAGLRAFPRTVVAAILAAAVAVGLHLLGAKIVGGDPARAAEITMVLLAAALGLGVGLAVELAGRPRACRGARVKGRHP